MRSRQDRLDEDVQAAIGALGPLLLGGGSIKADLRGADLRNADLRLVPEDRVLLDETTELGDSTGFGSPVSPVTPI